MNQTPRCVPGANCVSDTIFTADITEKENKYQDATAMWDLGRGGVCVGRLKADKAKLKETEY